MPKKHVTERASSDMEVVPFMQGDVSGHDVYGAWMPRPGPLVYLLTKTGADVVNLLDASLTKHRLVDLTKFFDLNSVMASASDGSRVAFSTSLFINGNAGIYFVDLEAKTLQNLSSNGFDRCWGMALHGDLLLMAGTCPSGSSRTATARVNMPDKAIEVNDGTFDAPGLFSCCFGPTEESVAYGDNLGYVLLHDTSGNYQSQAFRTRGQRIFGISWHHGIDIIAAVGNDDAIYLIDPTQRSLGVVRCQFSNVRNFIAWHPSKPILAASTVDGNVFLFRFSLDSQTIKVSQRVLVKVSDYQPICLKWSSDGRFLVTASMGGKIMVWVDCDGDQTIRGIAMESINGDRLAIHAMFDYCSDLPPPRSQGL